MSLKANLSQLKDFLALIATQKGDVSNITAPPFVLSSKSATEIPASWASNAGLFLAQGQDEDPAKRALAVLKNFLSSLKAQTYTGRSEEEGLKKPLNAFLGELFLAEFKEHHTTTRLISEQVSHHPPVTACFLYNKEYGISAEGYVRQQVSFSPTSGVNVQEIGHALVNLQKYDEYHLMTLPTLRAKGVLTGSPYPELDGTCFITSTSGFTSKITFEGTGLLGTGTKNSVHAVLSSNDDPEKALFEVTGQWNDTLTIHDCTADKDIDSVVINDLKPSEPQVVPVEEQDPWESRSKYAWGPTIEGIIAQDLKQVSQAKNKVEEAQRAMRKAEEEAGREWPRLFFQRNDKDEIFEKLAAHVKEPMNLDLTDGIWKFIGIEAAERIEKPYHRDLTPIGQL